MSLAGLKSSGIMQRRVVLRADAGRSIGFGHFVRTVALAAYLRDSFDCHIVSLNPEGTPMSEYQTRLIKEAGAQPLPCPGISRGDGDRNFIDLLLPEDITVLDNYFYSTEYQKEVKNHSHALVCIDDMHDRHFVSDVVMTFCPLRREDFSLDNSTRFYGGTEWSFLREPFLRPSKERKGFTYGRHPRITIAMGGADPFRLTDKMIEIIHNISPGACINVLAGQTVEILTPPGENINIYRQADAECIARLFDNSDFGIFPASTVCVEAFARHLPVIAGYYVDNQEEFYARGVEYGWFAPLGCLLDEAEFIENRLRNIITGHMIPPSPDFDFTHRRNDIINIFKSLL